jgi:lipid A 3-O-deacylase
VLSLPGVYVEGGRVLRGRGTDVASVGLVLPLPWGKDRWGKAVSFHAEVFASHWQARDALTTDDTFSQVGVVGSARYRFDEGRSPWFVEAGVGLTHMDRLYLTGSRQFSTRFQFTEMLGLGFNLGKEKSHEVSLRMHHFSNAGIEDPNPGENFIRVRYAYWF